MAATQILPGHFNQLETFQTKQSIQLHPRCPQEIGKKPKCRKNI